jgi:hypothetical protein
MLLSIHFHCEYKNLSNMPKKHNNKECSEDSSNDYKHDCKKSDEDDDEATQPEPFYFQNEIEEKLFKIQTGQAYMNEAGSKVEEYSRNMKQESKLPQASKR